MALELQWPVVCGGPPLSPLNYHPLMTCDMKSISSWCSPLLTGGEPIHEEKNAHLLIVNDISTSINFMQTILYHIILYIIELYKNIFYYTITLNLIYKMNDNNKIMELR
jgi:hypothetical protein